MKKKIIKIKITPLEWYFKKMYYNSDSYYKGYRIYTMKYLCFVIEKINK